MPSTRLLLLTLALSAPLPGPAADPAPDRGTGVPPLANPITDGDLKTILRDYVDSDKLGVGLAVGIVSERGRQVVGYGRLDNGTDAQVDGETVFGIGSVTKVFTALLLQDMIERGEMKLDDPVQKFLPPSVTLPKYKGKEIRLLHLATHTSGLPRDDSGDFYASLSHCTLARAPGTEQEYSNLGMDLLGHVIALKAGKDYETLVVERICQPLGMNSTRISLPPDLRSRLAIGHAVPGHRVRGFSGVALYPGAGALHSTVNDLLRFVAAFAGLAPSPLAPLMEKARALHPVESGGQLRLAWSGEGPVFEHGGLVNGYQAELAFDLEKRRGVVVLSSCANYGTFVPGVWRALLEGRSPRPANTVPADPALYDRYAGQYRIEQVLDIVSVRRVENRLLFQFLGEPGARAHYPSFEMFPASASTFGNEFRQTEATFQPGQEPHSIRLTLTSLGLLSGFQGSVNLARVSTIVPPPPALVRLDSAAYDAFAGRYRNSFLFGLIHLGPTLVITHQKDEWDDHLLASAQGYGLIEVFPENEARFVADPTTTEDLRLTFVRNKRRVVTGVVVDWNGERHRGARLADTSSHPSDHHPAVDKTMKHP